MIDNKAAIMIIKMLAKQGGITLTKDDISNLNKHHSQGMYHKKRNSEIFEAMESGFFVSASLGEMFIPESDIDCALGNTIQNNYPEASSSFLNFAKTYWSLRVLISKLNKDNDGHISFIGGRLLGVLEGQIGPIFFPMPGHEQAPPDKREAAQREYFAIQANFVDIDIEDFIRGNPILIRDKLKLSQSSGCLSILIIGFIAVTSHFIYNIMLA